MSRSLAREKAFFLIFEYIFNKEISAESFDNYLLAKDINFDDTTYLKTVSSGVKDRYDELVKSIASKSQGFKADRLYKTDLAILLLAAYEIKYCPDIPVSVSCNEAVNLAKIYSTEKSPPYINGILANIAKETDK